MIGKRSWAILAVGCSVACAPVNPSQSAVVGRWKVAWACGAEALDLKANGTYSYTIAFTAGGQAADSGQWRLVAKAQRFEGAHVILQNALDTCSVFGDKTIQPGRRDRQLETIWEWGRMILSFNPDTQGFTRAE